MKESPVFLNRVLQLNAFSCLLFGGLFALEPIKIAQFLGTAPNELVFYLGCLLILHGAHLLWASLRAAKAIEILYFSIGDFSWVALTITLIFYAQWITTSIGIVTALGVASFVGLLGALQLYCLSNKTHDMMGAEVFEDSTNGS